MISGTYVLTDSIDQAFDKIFTDIRKGSNAVISGKSAFDLSEGSGVTEPTFDESLLEEVRAVDGVAEAEGSVDSDTTQLIGDDGKAVVFGGAPNLGFLEQTPTRVSTADAGRRGVAWAEGGRRRQGDGGQGGLRGGGDDRDPGRRPGPASQDLRDHAVQLRSLDRRRHVGRLDLPTAQRLMRKEGRLDEIAVASKPGVTDAELVRRSSRSS